MLFLERLMMCAQPLKDVIVPAGAKLGARKAILNDLSPAACHISYNYTHPVDVHALKAEFARQHCGFVGKKTHHTRIASVPVVTNYECHGSCKPKRRSHPTTEEEKRRIAEIEAKEIPYWYPTNPFSDVREMHIRSALHLRNITRVCDFYTKRNLWALAAVWGKISEVSGIEGSALRFIHT